MARLKSTDRTPTQTPYGLNEQIRQLQQQMAEERVLQQQRQQQFRDVLTDRLTSWPVLLGAVAAGVMLRQINTATQVPAQPPITTTPDLAAAAKPEHTAGSAVSTATPPEPPPSFWGTLLSLPLLTQSVWWLLQQLWQSRLFRDLVRQKLIKSEQRHPPY